MGRETLTALRAGAPLRAGGYTIVPLERLDVFVTCDGRRVLARAGKRAAAFVVRDAHATWALDEAGRPLQVEDLLSRAEGLREVLSDGSRPSITDSQGR